MSVSILILSAALAQPAPAEAAFLDILVPQLRLGMDKQQFHALWPKYRAQFGPGCTAKINANIRDHKLYAVGLESAEKEPNLACGKFVHDWAYAALGKPKDNGDHEAPGVNCAPGNGIGYSALAQSAPCGTPDVEDWASWEPQEHKYEAGLGVQRKSGGWSFNIYPRR
jgi:hypothetical protein